MTTIDFTHAVKPYELPKVWSPQQRTFIDWMKNGKGSVVLEAVAGSGKTTTILGAIVESKASPVAVLAYNTKIAEEIDSKLKQLGVDWKQARAGTVHSFGFAALRKTFGNIKVDEKKLLDLIKPSEYRDIVRSMVSLAKQRAVGVVCGFRDIAAWYDIINHFDLLDENFKSFDVDELISEAIAVLKASNAQTDVIDFDDMVYLPLIHPVRFFRYSVVIIDEAQDTNPARRELAKRLIAPGGRLAAVGDRHQAIYGFTGADNDSLDLIERDFKASRMPLTISYRCPKQIVEFAHQWVDHIMAAETAKQGSVEYDVRFSEFDPKAGSAILCRNTKPLVQAAFTLIRRSIPCKIEGRDIGKGLIKLANRWHRAKTTEAFRTRLEGWIKSRRAQDTGNKLDIAEDQYATLVVILDQCDKEGKVRREELTGVIEGLFADNVTGVVTLSTIHKSKGREWNTVYWLNRLETCPSKWAKQGWELRQEDNLCYVAATRSMDQLIHLTIGLDR